MTTGPGEGPSAMARLEFELMLMGRIDAQALRAARAIEQRAQREVLRLQGRIEAAIRLGAKTKSEVARVTGLDLIAVRTHWPRKR